MREVCMKSMKMFLSILFGVMIFVSFGKVSSVCAENLQGTWDLYVEVIKGSRKGEKSQHITDIIQQPDGRIDGKTRDKDNKQVGRVSGLVKRTKIELTFSQGKKVYRSDLSLSHNGTFMGGIFRRLDGNEGIIYGVKHEDIPSKTTP